MNAGPRGLYEHPFAGLQGGAPWPGEEAGVPGHLICADAVGAGGREQKCSWAECVWVWGLSSSWRAGQLS